MLGTGESWDDRLDAKRWLWSGATLILLASACGQGSSKAQPGSNNSGGAAPAMTGGSSPAGAGPGASGGFGNSTRGGGGAGAARGAGGTNGDVRARVPAPGGPDFGGGGEGLAPAVKTLTVNDGAFAFS